MDNNINNSNPFSVPDAELDLNIWDTGILQSDERHRLNDYDNNLFSESAYKSAEDEIFRIEYRINQLEIKLKNINSQLESAKAIKDFRQIDLLNLKKHQYENELKILYQNYNNRGIPSKLSGSILSLAAAVPEKFINIAKNFIGYIRTNFAAKISTKFNSMLHLKDALIKLENINKNIDDLVSIQAPYGEGAAKYDRLLQYLNKADIIQYQISQMVNTAQKNK